MKKNMLWTVGSLLLVGLVGCGGDDGPDEIEPGESGEPGQLDDRAAWLAMNASCTSNASLCAMAVASGLYHTCAVLNDGTARCWGWNRYGQLGIELGSSTPVVVSGL